MPHMDFQKDVSHSINSQNRLVHCGVESLEISTFNLRPELDIQGPGFLSISLPERTIVDHPACMETWYARLKHLHLKKSEIETPERQLHSSMLTMKDAVSEVFVDTATTEHLSHINHILTCEHELKARNLNSWCKEDIEPEQSALCLELASESDDDRMWGYEKGDEDEHMEESENRDVEVEDKEYSEEGSVIVLSKDLAVMTI